jgi:hypothetical protein
VAKGAPATWLPAAGARRLMRVEARGATRPLPTPTHIALAPRILREPAAGSRVAGAPLRLEGQDVRAVSGRDGVGAGTTEELVRPSAIREVVKCPYRGALLSHECPSAIREV